MGSYDDGEGNKKRNMRKRKNVESVDETNQLQKKRKKSQALVPQTVSKTKRKTKVKVEIKTQLKPPKKRES